MWSNSFHGISSSKSNDDRAVLISTFSEKQNIKTQRESLLSLNYDKLYWVYEVLSENKEVIELRLLENCLVAFPNQAPNLQWLEDAKDITILDLHSLQKAEIKVLCWPNFEKNDKKIVMCSWWMIDFFLPKNLTWENWSVHMLTSLRDAWWTSINQRTTVAWRVVWDDIRYNISLESAEEAPFLWMVDWEFYLAVWNDYFDYLVWSIHSFLETKYDPSNPELKKIFERWFRWVIYEELWKVLQDIVDNNRFVTYKSEDINNLPWLEHLKRSVIIGEKKDIFYTVFNPDQNTYEFKIFKKFIWFPEWFSLPWSRPNRLFLESFNQYPRFNRLSNATKINPSGAIKIFTKIIQEQSSDIIFALKNN